MFLRFLFARIGEEEVERAADDAHENRADQRGQHRLYVKSLDRVPRHVEQQRIEHESEEPEGETSERQGQHREDRPDQRVDEPDHHRRYQERGYFIIVDADAQMRHDGERDSAHHPAQKPVYHSCPPAIVYLDYEEWTRMVLTARGSRLGVICARPSRNDVRGFVTLCPSPPGKSLCPNQHLV